MFELVFLGTSASAPSVARNVSATLLLFREHRFLIDAGEGTQRQLLRSGLGFRKLHHVLITHGHLDHILGLAGLVSTFARWEMDQQKLEIMGSKRSLQRVRDLLLGVVLRGQKGGMWVEFTEIEAGEIFSDAHLEIHAFPVPHRGTRSMGYVFQERARQPFLNERAEALGVPFGPERAELVAGRAVTLADGRRIEPSEVLGEAVRGTRVVYVGDVDRTDVLLPHVQEADALVIEATYAEGERELVGRHGHITAGMAASLAREAGVGALYLNHISRRYNGPELESEAQTIFPASTVVKDFDHITVRRSR